MLQVLQPVLQSLQWVALARESDGQVATHAPLWFLYEEAQVVHEVEFTQTSQLLPQAEHKLFVASPNLPVPQEATQALLRRNFPLSQLEQFVFTLAQVLQVTSQLVHDLVSVALLSVPNLPLAHSHRDTPPA